MLASACLTTLLLTASAACLTVCFVVSSWLAAASRGGPAQSALPPSQQPTEPAFEFEVYDDVLNATTLRALVDAVGAEKPDGVYFDLRSPQMTPLEAALACVLREAGDEMPIVEYWHRADARSINVHRDTDEAEYEDATSGEQQRCPAYAHVLYLSLSPGLRAPTVLWEEEGRGAQAAGERRGGPLSAALRSLTAVPAVEGRLLRFQGDVAHDVPYPPLEYFDAEQEAATGGVLRWASHALERWRGAADRAPPQRRLVALFNSWPYVPAGQSLADAALKRSADELREPESPSQLCASRREWRRVTVRHVGTGAGGVEATGDGRGDAAMAGAGSGVARLAAGVMGSAELNSASGLPTAEAKAERAAAHTALTAASDVHVVALAPLAGAEAPYGETPCRWLCRLWGQAQGLMDAELLAVNAAILGGALAVRSFLL